MSVRIGSPGDDGGVSQTISVSTGADSQQNSGSQTQTTQSGSANISISVRVDSPGSNGAVTQTTSTAATAAPATTTQYQQPAAQYPATSTAAVPTPQPDPPPAAPQPDPSPAPAPAPPQPVTAAPTSWVWNLTVSSCGDTSVGDTTQTIDTGIQGWIWNWNLGTICQPQAPTASVNTAESATGISPPSVAMPDPPTPPTVISPEPPALPFVPQPVIATAPPVAITVPVLGRIELTPVTTQEDPLTLPQAVGLLSPVPLRRGPPHHARSTTHRPTAGVLAASATLAPPAQVVVTRPVRDARPAPHKTATSHRAPPWETLSLILDSSFAPAPAGASAGGAGGGASGGAAALLSLWLLLQLPGFATLRLPARQRRPRGRVDDKQTRPG